MGLVASLLLLTKRDARPSTNWFDLPFNLREMIIDEMDAKTRCRFTRCSKLCEKEAKESKNYVYLISILMNEEKLYLYFQYGNEGCEEDSQIAFTQIDKSKTLVVFERKSNEVVTSESFTTVESGPPFLVRAKYAKKYIDKYRNSIRVFDLEDNLTIDFNLKSFNLNNLNKLEELVIAYLCKEDVEVSRLSKLIDLDKLFQLKSVSLMSTVFDFEHLLKFNSSFVMLKLKTIDDQKAFQYLKMWRDEEIHENVYQRVIYIDKLLNVEQIAHQLGAYNYVKFDLGFLHKYSFDCNSKKNRAFNVVIVPATTLEVNWI